MEQFAATDNSIATESTGLELTRSISVAGSTYQMIKSCNSIWLFDTKKKRYRRTPKGINIEMPSPESEWAAYDRVELDDATPAFTLFTGEGGSRIVQSWRHSEPCVRCAETEATDAQREEDATTELSLAELRAALRD